LPQIMTRKTKKKDNKYKNTVKSFQVSG